MSRANFDKDSLQAEILRMVVERGMIRINELHQLLNSHQQRDRAHVGRAIAALGRAGYTLRDCTDEITATRNGKRLIVDLALQNNHESARQAALQMAAPRVMFARSPEVLKLSTRPGPIRADSDDWRSIPSRMGDVLRLPTGEVVQG